MGFVLFLFEDWVWARGLWRSAGACSWTDIGVSSRRCRRGSLVTGGGVFCDIRDEQPRLDGNLRLASQRRLHEWTAGGHRVSKDLQCSWRFDRIERLDLFLP